MKGTKTLQSWLPLSVLLPLSIGAVVNFSATAVLADGPMPIQNLTVDGQQNIVVVFAPNSGSPAQPNLHDEPGPQHKLVLDFPSSIIDRSSMPSAATSLAALTKAFPQVRGIRYAIVNGGAAPAARIVLDLPEDATVKPSVVKLGNGSVTINLGLAAATAAAPSIPTEAAVPAETPATPAVSTSEKRIQLSDLEQGTPAVATMPTGNGGSTPTVPSAISTPLPASEVAPPTAAEAPPAAMPTETTPVASAPTTTPPVAEATKSALEAAPPSLEATKPTGDVPPIVEASKPVEVAPEVSAVPAKSEPTPPAEVTTPAEKPTTMAEGDLERPSRLAPRVTASEESTALTQTATVAPAAVPAQKEESIKPDDSQRLVASAGSNFNTNVIPKSSAELDPLAGVNSAQETKTETKIVVSPEAASKRADADTHFKSAVKFHVAGNFPAAIAEYRATIAIDPHLAEPYCNLGLIYNQQHNFQAALDQFHKALAVNPKDAITYNGVGAALRAEKDMQGAIKNWQTAIQMDPNLATAYYNLGTAYEIERDYDKALESYREAASRDHKLGEAYYRAGLILQRRNSPSQALLEFNKALRATERAEYTEDARRRIATLSNRSVH